MQLGNHLLDGFVVIREFLDFIVDLIDIDKKCEIVFLDGLEVLNERIDIRDPGRTFNVLESSFVFFDDGIEGIIGRIAKVASIFFYTNESFILVDL